MEITTYELIIITIITLAIFAIGAFGVHIIMNAIGKGDYLENKDSKNIK